MRLRNFGIDAHAKANQSQILHVVSPSIRDVQGVSKTLPFSFA